MKAFSLLLLAASAHAQLVAPILPGSPIGPLALPAPLVPAPGGMGTVLPSLSPTLLSPSLVLPPALAPDAGRLRGSLREFGARAPMSAPAPEYVRNAGASEEFRAKVNSLLRSLLPEALLRDLLGHGYTLLVKRHLSQDRPDFPPDYDYTGGLHDWGPLGSHIMVAERIKNRTTGEWMESQVWRNASVHETGHAVDRILGATDSGEYREAWEADFAEIPPELGRPFLPNGRRNDFYYFLRPGADGGRDLARQETFAEAFDVLVRGRQSSFNYENFVRRFPRTLKKVREIVERRYGPVASADFGPP